MDYLPVQATSVLCERVFLLSKETDTAKQNHINPVLMEAIQLLKFWLKKQHLNFTARWSMSESAMGGPSNPSGDLLNDLFMCNPDSVMDNILNEFTTYDHKS